MGLAYPFLLLTLLVELRIEGRQLDMQFISAISVFIFRVLAVVLHIQLPTFNPKLNEKSEQEKGVS